MDLVVLVLVPVAVGLGVFWLLLARREPNAAERRRKWRRFALTWGPFAALLIVIVELVSRA